MPIADDTASVCDRFPSAVEGAGHEALAARSGAEPLVRVRSALEQINLIVTANGCQRKENSRGGSMRSIVLDLRLPCEPGVDLVPTIRRMDDRRLPLPAFEAITRADEDREVAGRGARGCP